LRPIAQVIDMASPTLHQVIDEFKIELSNSTKLLDKVEQSPGALHQPQVDLIFELAFLKIFIAWEQFLENSFIRYMCGASSLSGRNPRRIVSAKHLEDALRVVCGDRLYADWTSVDVIINRANSFFDNGEPYSTPLQSAAVELTNMKKIRNHIVHHSKKSRDDFRKIFVNVYGFRPQGMSAGRFLRQRIGPHNERCVKQYTKTLELLAKMIVA
ncbi:hypothetical protein ACFLWY_02645, partial [Chloroflexota bacterium]